MILSPRLKKPQSSKPHVLYISPNSPQKARFFGGRRDICALWVSHQQNVHMSKSASEFRKNNFFQNITRNIMPNSGRGRKNLIFANFMLRLVRAVMTAGGKIFWGWSQMFYCGSQLFLSVLLPLTGPHARFDGNILHNSGESQDHLFQIYHALCNEVSRILV